MVDIAGPQAEVQDAEHFERIRVGFGAAAKRIGQRSILIAVGLVLQFAHLFVQLSGVLIECGFLSNMEEEALLRDDVYQRKLCTIIAATTAEFLTK